MRMSSFLFSATLLAVLAVLSPQIHALDEDFDFDVSDDLEVEIDGGSRKLWSNKEITAAVGKAFHLVVPKDAFSKDVQHYEAKQSNGNKPLPPWLLFDKIGGVFWGVPLEEDVDKVKLVIRVLGDKNISEEIEINVVETSDFNNKCPSSEDNTVLTLLIDKGVRAIKPKQRVIAINNIAKFFGLPFSAFTLKPQLGKDDITDSSVVLAGPGNLRTRSSKITSLLQVPVGCDGRLWVQTAPLIHQLKQQARDGTISEVLGLPLIGWRVRTETKPVLRAKRQIDDYGSGDYDDDYYDGYDEYDDDSNPDEPLNKPDVTPRVSSTASTSTTSTTITTTTTSITTPSTTPTHPHRHHHGESINAEESDFSIPIGREHHHQSSTPKSHFESNVPTLPMIIPDEELTSPSTPRSSTSTTTTTTTTTTEKPTTEQQIKSTTSSTLRKFDGVLSPDNTNTNLEYDDDDYDYDLEEDNEEDPIESQTIVPNAAQPKQTTSATTSVHEPERISPTSERTTVKEVVAETLPPTTTEMELVIVEDTAAPPIVIDAVETTEMTEPPTTTVTTIQTEPVTVAMTPSSTTSTTTTTTTSTTTTTTTTTPSTPTTQIPTTVYSTTQERNITLEGDEYETTTMKMTTSRHIISTPRTTTVREITEGVEYGSKNFPPHIDQRLKHMSVIAGKIFRFVIPKNTFSDLEDGEDLKLEFLNAKGEPLPANSWCHFNPVRNEIYGLPLEEDVSKWEYVVKATDREGASASDRLTIQVQQHKLQRVVNHEFSLFIRIEKQQEFPHFVDWCLKTLRALGKIYNTNMSEITVRNVSYTDELAVFTWTNDSIPTNHCPAGEIEQLFKMLTANDRGDPARELNQLLAPELRVKKVTKHGLGVCETPQLAVTPPTNFPPFLRNPVDHINATVGELLLYKVPDDTFYDPEDTDSRTLNISLLTADRQPLKPNHWLQFDSKNREFYGIPRKASRSEYQLICVDSAGLPATDSLEIVVYPAPKIQYNVEFSMTVETPYDTFVNSASAQRKFVEKLQEVFGDQNTSFIHLNPFKQGHGSTIITWHNKSLSTIKCPHEQIKKLESVLKNHDRSISSRVHSIMDPEFPVSSLKVIQTGICKTKPYIPPPPITEDTIIPIDEKTPEATSSDEYQYLMTFIVPAVIISIMLFLAAVAACVLYRRRRTGKMNVEEDGRQSYGNKGIPVIFQEELDEKPEPGTKTPVILKDEKPPLAPPEYSKSGSLKLTDDSEPYQPPPPFTRTQDNGRQPRPKPTPTYRKPPPYVPP